MLSPDRFFDPDPSQRNLARRLYALVAQAPIVSPHGHVDPRLFADPDASFGSPVDLLILPDHYITRILFSQGLRLEALGVPRRDGELVEANHRKIWQIFAEHFYLFRGTPSGIWLAHELAEVFGVEPRLQAANAQAVYEQLAERLKSPEFAPRALFERFNIQVLCTTDSATASLEYHQAVRASGWRGDLRPTFRPDAVTDLSAPGWGAELQALCRASGSDITTYAAFTRSLAERRVFFKSLGATASDHAAQTAACQPLSAAEAEAIFQRALRGASRPGDAERFAAHMLFEMARLSLEDGLVMQLHSGSLRNHHPGLFAQFGANIGADIPLATEYTRALRPLLERFGCEPGFTLILFTLDETSYARELAPLAGVYPAVKLGPPWWFHDSLNGMRRYFDQVMETAGLYNTAGFNDDTRAFPSIPARHDLWRRASANWLAGLVIRGIVAEEEAAEMIHDLAYRLARRAYRLE
jgi:glucuronate isomerase